MSDEREGGREREKVHSYVRRETDRQTDRQTEIMCKFTWQGNTVKLGTRINTRTVWLIWREGNAGRCICNRVGDWELLALLLRSREDFWLITLVERTNTHPYTPSLPTPIFFSCVHSRLLLSLSVVVGFFNCFFTFFGGGGGGGGGGVFGRYFFFILFLSLLVSVTLTAFSWQWREVWFSKFSFFVIFPTLKWNFVWTYILHAFWHSVGFFLYSCAFSLLSCLWRGTNKDLDPTE